MMATISSTLTATENGEQAAEQVLLAALVEIRDHWANQYDHPRKSGPMYAGPYGIGVTDGHRACAIIATRAIDKIAMIAFKTATAVQAMHKENRKPLYDCWKGMKARCFNQNSKDYPNYGGRGIGVHPGWINDFQSFAAYIGQRPTPAHSIDRINNDGNYEPGNVRWATPFEQQQNTTRTRIITFNGRSLSCAAWARELGISGELLYSRLNKLNWPIEKALSGILHPEKRPRKRA